MTSNKHRQEKTEQLQEKRFNTLCSWLANYSRDQAQRLAETKKIFGGLVTVADLHTHSEFSDGKATIAMNREAAVNAGMDLVFATDHHSLGQKRAVRGIPSMSWGQEPGGGMHHIGLLHNRRRFTPGKDEFARNFARAGQLAPFVWIPHPAGWYPKTTYSEEKIAALWDIGPSFAMEVINGAAKIGRAFDKFDEAAVAAWDRLLMDGRRVTPVGASDAHVPEGIGCCWTGLPGVKANPEDVIKALNRGCCMASESSLLSIRVKGRRMGSAVKVATGSRQTMSYRVADSAGLQCVRFIVGGRVRRTIYPRDRQLVSGEWSFVPSRRDGYVRLESRAVDNRRAFSAPVYLSHHK